MTFTLSWYSRPPRLLQSQNRYWPLPLSFFLPLFLLAFFLPFSTLSCFISWFFSLLLFVYTLLINCSQHCGLPLCFCFCGHLIRPRPFSYSLQIAQLFKQQKITIFPWFLPLTGLPSSSWTFTSAQVLLKSGLQERQIGDKRRFHSGPSSHLGLTMNLILISSFPVLL